MLFLLGSILIYSKSVACSSLSSNSNDKQKPCFAKDFENNRRRTLIDRDGTCGTNLTYSFKSATGTITISGTGKMTDYNHGEDPPWYKWRFQIKHIIIQTGVTSIGNQAFGGSSTTSISLPEGLISIGSTAFSSNPFYDHITIPSTVKYIGNSAFSYSDSLQSVEIKSYYCLKNFRQIFTLKNIKNVTISGPITSIPEYAFQSCVALTTINFGSVTSIGALAFSFCSSLKSIIIPENITYIGENAFISCSSLTTVTIPDKVKTIETGAFHQCQNLESINISENNDYYKSLNGILFLKNGSSLIKYPPMIKDNNYTIPDNVITISKYAFYQCKYLESIIIPDGVTNIGEKSFYDCNSLKSIIIPDSVNQIGTHAFSDCDSMTVIEVSENNPNFASFNKILYNKEFTMIIGIPRGIVGNITLHDNLETIEKGAFYDCRSLTSIFIPEKVNKIPDRTFSGCYNLTSIHIPSNTISFGEYAFDCCISLESISIPSSVSDIGKEAFSTCKSLATIEINNDYCVTNFHEIFENSYRTKSVILGNGVTYINNASFSKYNIKSIIIPSSVKEIRDDAFLDCSDLTSVSIANGVKSFGNRCFSGCHSLKSFIIPDSVVSIGASTFSYDQSLESIYIGSDLESIGELSFSYLDKLNSFNVSKDNKIYSSFDGLLYTKNFTILELVPMSKTGNCILHDNLTSIPNAAFIWHFEITSITIPSSVTSIGFQAFQSCKGITSLVIPSSVTSIGYQAFLGCKGITSLVIPSSVTSIGSSTFQECSGLTSLEISSSLTKIPNTAFSDCFGITSLIIPSSVTFIDYSAFENCYQITYLEMNHGLETISYNAFKNCSSILSLNIPSSITSIGKYAFYKCSLLSSVKFFGTKEPEIGKYIFLDCNALEYIEVPIDYEKDTFCEKQVNKTLILDSPSSSLEQDSTADTATPTKIIIDESTNNDGSSSSSNVKTDPIEPTNTEAPTFPNVDVPEIIITVTVPDNSNEDEVDKVLKEEFNKYNESKGTNKVIQIESSRIAFNSDLAYDQFIKPIYDDSEIDYKGGNLNLILPDHGKVNVLIGDEKANLSINGEGELNIQHSNSQSKSISLTSNSRINGSVQITVPDEIETLTLDSILLEDKGSISLKKQNNQKETNFNVKSISTSKKANAKISNITVLNSIRIVQTSTINIENVTLSGAVVNFDIIDFNLNNNNWNTFIKGTFNNPPSSLVLNQISNEKPVSNKEYVLINGLFEKNMCVSWLQRINYGNCGFNLRSCIYNPLQETEDQRIVLKNAVEEGPGGKSNNGSKLSGGQIAGIVIGCIAGVAIIVIAVVFIIKKKNSSQSESQDDGDNLAL
ncbi:hypothetical protein M9Y10_003872 [Tritrichomonas musculus]|uniref:Surface antigen BspA-like n=1 Tax=Tritrichomonas musculus TaxID=1915356 RepID=A0ABR2JQY8_9EUKA